jgi:hypothetical protein
MELVTKASAKRMPSLPMRSIFGVYQLTAVAADGLHGMVVGHDEDDVRRWGLPFLHRQIEIAGKGRDQRKQKVKTI